MNAVDKIEDNAYKIGFRQGFQSGFRAAIERYGIKTALRDVLPLDNKDLTK